MLSGTVANWSRDFGFLRRSEGPDVFVHKRRLPPGIRLHNGDTVTFSVHQEEGGKPEAVNIVLVSKKLSRELAQPAQVARRRPGVMAELTAGEPEGLKEPPPGSDGRKVSRCRRHRHLHHRHLHHLQLTFTSRYSSSCTSTRRASTSTRCAAWASATAA